jgi:oligopeptide transport system substrate-binding protein
VKAKISRREMLGAPVVLAGCASASPYFARTIPPSTQHLVYANGEEPISLDPAQLNGSRADNVVAALLDSLTALHPFTHEPVAGLATHYEIDGGDTRYTFSLRGCRMPRGTRLPNTDHLPGEFSRGRRAPPDHVPAFWSDGVAVTAHDFVFAWRRLVDPATAASLAFYLSPITNADEVSKGKKPVETLAVFAPDEFTLQFQLTSPSAAFIKLLWQPFLAAVPRHAVAPGWTAPGRYLSSGPFALQEWRPYDRIVLTKNRRYWEADSVELDKLTLLPNADGTTAINLYRSGMVNVVGRGLVPPTFVPILGGKKDFASARAFRSTWYSMDVTRPPLDGLQIRYALSLATDRRAIANFLRGDKLAAQPPTLDPSLAGDFWGGPPIQAMFERLQISGPRRSESVVFDAAAAYEKATEWHGPHPDSIVPERRARSAQIGVRHDAGREIGCTESTRAGRVPIPLSLETAFARFR